MRQHLCRLCRLAASARSLLVVHCSNFGLKLTKVYTAWKLFRIRAYVEHEYGKEKRHYNVVKRGICTLTNFHMLCMKNERKAYYTCPQVRSPDFFSLFLLADVRNWRSTDAEISTVLTLLQQCLCTITEFESRCRIRKWPLSNFVFLYVSFPINYHTYMAFKRSIVPQNGWRNVNEAH